MKTIVIVGSTRQVARERLQTMVDGSEIQGLEGYDEVIRDGHRYLAMGGSKEDVCWLRGLGFHIEKIITVEADGISKRMGKRINQVCSTISGLEVENATLHNRVREPRP